MSTSALIKHEGAAWAVADKVTATIENLKSSQEIISSLGLDYSVSAHNVKTDIDEPVPNFWGIYRDDEQKFLGIAQSPEPKLIQNVDTFQVLEPMLEASILNPVVADTYLGGKICWGIFEINPDFLSVDTLYNDPMANYIIVQNNHLRPDGQLTFINTPIRIACMNAMSSVFANNYLKFSLPGILDATSPEYISESIKNNLEHAGKYMNLKIEKLVNTKITRDGIDKILDSLFPYVNEDSTEAISHVRANAAVEAQREAFITCLSADNLANYNGTAYQVFNALTDYVGHYTRNSKNAFELSKRMTLIPGFDPQASTENIKVNKFLKNLDKFALAA